MVNTFYFKENSKVSKTFYMKLAWSNIKKNSGTYIPYLLTCIGTITMYYIMYALANDEGLKDVFGGGELGMILIAGTYALAFFSAVFLFYTHSFLIKKRKKEFGLYNILGMEKKHIAKILFYETFYVSAGSLAAGVLAGTLLSKLFLLILIKLIKIDVPVKLHFSGKAALASMILFGIVFILTFLETVWQIRSSKPVELLTGGNVGEKEPKTKWFITIIGFICLGIGYYIAITTTSPLTAIPLFLLAVIVVMIGTYCLFTSGSIAILKTFRKNKKYYYQTKHFTSVSGMIYRMKQNAVGLANICILSTGFLLMISASISLYAGLDELVKQRYPDEICVYMQRAERAETERFKGDIQQEIEKMGIAKEDVVEESGWTFAAFQSGNDFKIVSSMEAYTNADVAMVNCMLAKDYERLTGETVTLASGEMQVNVITGNLSGDTINFYGKEFKIKNKIEGDSNRITKTYIVSNMYYFIFPDEAAIKEFYAGVPEEYQDNNYSYSIGISTGADAKTQMTQGDTLSKWLEDVKSKEAYQADDIYIECREANRDSINSLYGGMFFVGIFMGMLFLMATVLIIYYKQISEGYDDRERFDIMQKVGMSQKEVRRSIRSQVLTVFYIPLFTACVHMTFAFPIMRRLMALLNLTNVKLFIMACIATVIVFAIIYALVYSLTARTYYRIVREAK